MCELAEALVEGEKDLDGQRYDLPHKVDPRSRAVHWECVHEPEPSTGNIKHSVWLRLRTERRVARP